jgi:L-alanine-DL-glutamate epimerase-like enolase superfamily enzyme
MKQQRDPRSLRIELERWQLRTPLRTSSLTLSEIEIVLVRLQHHDYEGRGEAVGVTYRQENAASISRQIESIRTSIEEGMSRQMLLDVLPAGGARNAVDCALWELEARLGGARVWQLAGIEAPVPLVTTFTIGVDEPQRMAVAALNHANARALKVKLAGDERDAERVQAVRDSRPDVWLAVDANGALIPASLEKLLPVLVDASVQLIEQPFGIGKEMHLDGFESPIPVAADESVGDLSDLPTLVGRFQAISIKLDKCGGLTAALALARRARDLGLDVFVGNMCGTSLAMAPAYLVGQLCKIVDLDGPVFLRDDRTPSVSYADGLVSCPRDLWG